MSHFLLTIRLYFIFCVALMRFGIGVSFGQPFILVFYCLPVDSEMCAYTGLDIYVTDSSQEQHVRSFNKGIINTISE